MDLCSTCTHINVSISIQGLVINFFYVNIMFSRYIGLLQYRVIAISGYCISGHCISGFCIMSQRGAKYRVFDCRVIDISGF
jgi:hypothetical protein